jgi:uncharacterized protein (TIGR02466 family)
MNIKNMLDLNDTKIDIFKCLILSSKLNIDNKELIKNFNFLKLKNKGRILSNNGGWQSNNLDLKDKKLNPLVEKIIEKSIQYMKLSLFKDNNFKLLNLWANINSYKDFNENHLHTDSLISGVYYLQTPKNCGNISFLNPCNYMEYSWNSKFFIKHNEYNSSKYFFKPSKNLLLLFPSWLFHKVEPNLNKKINRISISFNIGI